MENENIESADSQNGEVTLESLQAEMTKLQETNKQLFARAKKAEGFEQNSDGDWVKAEIKAEPKQKSSKQSGIDFGQLAFHNSKSGTVKIEHQDDISYLEEVMEESGKDMESILNSSWFSADLKSRQESRSVKEATPSNSRSSTESSKTSVDYWVKKGGLPEDTPANRELRYKIIEARTAQARSANKFADVSVIG